MGKEAEFLEAARIGNIKYVEKFLHSKTKKIAGPLASLRRGPGVNLQDASGYTALHHAALNGHIEIVQLLLSNDAQINICDLRGSSPLHLAAWAGHHDILKIFLNYSANNKEVNCNLQTIEMDTPLHCAAQHGHTGALATLLANGANPNLRNIRGESPLDLAAQYGRLQVVQILIRTHPELLLPFNVEQNQNFQHEEELQSNSHMASGTSFQSDNDLKSNTEEVYNLSSPLCLASRNGHKDIVEFLLCAGINVNYLTRSGTALHEAAVCGKENVVRILLKYGIDRNSRNFRGQTAIDVLKEFPEHVTKPILNILESDQQCSYGEQEYDGTDNTQTSNIKLYESYGNPANCYSDEQNYYVKCNHNAHLMATSPSSASDMYSQSISPVCMNQNFISDYYMQMGSTKILSTPPKKPPRRNLSMTLMEQHQQEQNLIRMHSTFNSKSDSGYEYIYKTGISEIKLKNSIKLLTKQNTEPNQPDYINYSSRTNKNSPNELKLKSKKNYNYEKAVLKSYNPNRKLKRNREYYETFSIDFNKDKSNKIMDIEKLEQYGKYPQSPTNYKQPPTPEHPPPSPSYAENLIFEFIMPLSQRSIYSSSGSIASSVSISDERSIISSTDCCVEEYIGDVPFAGLFKGSTMNLTGINNSSCDSEFINPTKLQYLMSQECNYIDTNLPAVFTTFQKQINDKPSNIHNKKHRSLSFNNVIDENPKYIKILETVPHSNLYSSTEYLNQYFPSVKLFQAEHTNSEHKDHQYDFEISNEEEEWLKISHSKSNSDVNRKRIQNLNENFDISDESHNFSITETENLENDKSNKFLNKSRLKISELQFLLKEFNIENIAEVLIENGWDNIKFMNGIIEESDFTIMKMPLNQHENMFKFIKSLPVTKKLLNFSKIVRNTTHLDPSFTSSNNNNEIINVDQWLEGLDLTEYTEVFRNHLYNNMESIFRIWEIELQTVLDIKKIGHRKRILYSVSNNRNRHQINSQSNQFDSTQHSISLGNQINSDLNILKANIIELNNDINDKLVANANLKVQIPAVVLSKLPGGKYVRYSKKKNRPAPKPPIQQKQNKENVKNDICHMKVNSFNKDNNTNNNYPSNSNSGVLPQIRAPSELLLGLPSNLETKWRHSASKLITESVRYNVYYLGSTIVKELRGTESTKKSIQKLKLNYKLLLTEEIHQESENVETFVYQKILNSKIHLVTLAISHRGVEFINVKSQKSICEHEIRNINCACQDSDDLRHFAYITKDSEVNTHYCHVFNVDKMDLATEIILTLGQAFEVAYQLALQDTRSIKILSQQSNISKGTK